MFELIWIPIVAALVAQVLKLITDGIPNNFNWSHIIGDYGGMPSSHTAFVTALATVIAFSSGLNSAAFAISLVLMVVVLRDAVGFRREIGRNASLTNTIAKKTFKTLPPGINYLNEQMGHSFSQVFAGFVLGIVLASFLYYLLAFI